MSKSIWNTRFTKKKLAMDAAVKDALVALDDWITIKGSHVELGEGGEILHGMGGKFAKLSDVPRKTVKQRQGESMGQTEKRAREVFAKQDMQALKEGFKKDNPKEWDDKKCNDELRNAGDKETEALNNVMKARQIYGVESQEVKDAEAVRKAWDDRIGEIRKEIDAREEAKEGIQIPHQWIHEMGTGNLKDVNGYKMPNATVPEKLAGAQDFFGKLSDGYKEAAAQARETNPYSPKAMACEQQAERYETLQNLARNWQELTPEKVQENVDRYGAGESVNNYVHYARFDTSGVGRWMAKDVVKKYDAYLSPRSKAEYNEKIDKMEYSDV